MGEVSRTKAVYQRELADFAAAVGDGILHGSNHVFDFLEALDLDDDSLKYNDKVILSSVLVRAREFVSMALVRCPIPRAVLQDRGRAGPIRDHGKDY